MNTRRLGRRYRPKTTNHLGTSGCPNFSSQRFLGINCTHHLPRHVSETDHAWMVTCALHPALSRCQQTRDFLCQLVHWYCWIPEARSPLRRPQYAMTSLSQLLLTSLPQLGKKLQLFSGFVFMAIPNPSLAFVDPSVPAGTRSLN